MNSSFETQFLVRESHLDTFGHVNNAKYFQVLEEARWDIITVQGYGLGEVQKRKQGPVVLEASIKFLKELHLRETITIRTKFNSFEGKTAKLQQTMIKPDGSTACEATFVVGFFDLNARKLIEPTPEWLKALGLT